MKYISSGIITCGFVVYLSLIWTKYIHYFWVPTSDSVSSTLIEEMRRIPAKAILASMVVIDDPAPKFEEFISPEFSISVADMGTDNNQVISLLPFNRDHPQMGTSSTKLAINSLGVVHYLLDKYEISKNTELIEQALNYTLSYAQWDRENAFTNSFNNNDHAVASRSFALVKLWLHYRDANEYSSLSAHKLINYAQSLGTKLESDTFYTYFSNHGSMQNLALMLLGSAFRVLPNADDWFSIGLSRFEEQIGYLLSDDGFFLEHSFGYQVFFTNILRTASTIVDSHPKFTSATIAKALPEALNLLENIHRTNGTLPAIGDTWSTSKISSAAPKTSSIKSVLFPVAGIAKLVTKRAVLGCKNQVTTLTMAWSHVKYHAHYRANEAAIDLFECQTQWWRASGYIPYWHFARASAEGWMGANAPHLSDEVKFISGATEPVSMIDSQQLQFIQVRRRLSHANNVEVADNYLTRSVYLFGVASIVVDQLTYKKPLYLNGDIQSFWTMSPDKIMSPGSRMSLEKTVTSSKTFDRFFFQASEQPVSMYTRFLSNRSLGVDSFVADPTSVRGWVQEDDKILPATTFKVSIPQSDNAMLIKTSLLLPSNAQHCEPAINVVISETHSNSFSLNILGCGLDYQLVRTETDIQLQTEQGLTISSIPPISKGFKHSLQQIDEKTRLAKDKYGPRFKPVYAYRVKVTLLGVAVFIFTLLLVWGHRYKGLVSKLISFSCATIWFVMPFWVYFIYLG
jgi:hypothetical protein